MNCYVCGKPIIDKKAAPGYNLDERNACVYFCSQRCLDKYGRYVNQIGGEDKRTLVRKHAKDQKDCFITTAVCQTLKKPDDCEELTKFRCFRDTYMQKTEALRSEIAEYYEIAPRICVEIEKAGNEKASEKYAMIWETSLKPAFEALDYGDLQKTYGIYKKMVLDLKQELLPHQKEAVPSQPRP